MSILLEVPAWSCILNIVVYADAFPGFTALLVWDHGTINMAYFQKDYWMVDSRDVL